MCCNFYFIFSVPSISLKQLENGLKALAEVSHNIETKKNKQTSEFLSRGFAQKTTATKFRKKKHIFPLLFSSSLFCHVEQAC